MPPNKTPLYIAQVTMVVQANNKGEAFSVVSTILNADLPCHTITWSFNNIDDLPVRVPASLVAQCSDLSEVPLSAIYVAATLADTEKSND